MSFATVLHDFFRFAFLVNRYPRPITALFLKRRDNEWRRLLRVLPSVALYFIGIMVFTLDGYFSHDPEAHINIVRYGASVLVLAFVLAYGLYAVFVLYMGVVCNMIGADWERLRTAVSLSCFSSSITLIAAYALTVGLMATADSYFDANLTNIVSTGLSLIFGAVALIVLNNIYVMAGQAINASASYVFYVTNVIPFAAAAVIVALAVKLGFGSAI